MYVFVFNWVPTLANSLGGFGAMAPVQGLLFSCVSWLKTPSALSADTAPSTI